MIVRSRPPAAALSDTEQSALLNLVKPWLIETIRASFSFLTLPEHLHIPIEMGAADVYRPHGILKVGVRRRTGRTAGWEEGREPVTGEGS